jgi:hypothetical protein
MGWNDLLNIKQQVAAAAAEDERRYLHPVECPHDGTPLEAGPSNQPGNVLHCRFCGFTVDG